MRKLRKSLLAIADITAIARVEGDPPQLISSPKVCVEVGYALQSKRREQLLLAAQERREMRGVYAFDLPRYQQVQFKNETELGQILPSAVETPLQGFNILMSGKAD